MRIGWRLAITAGAMFVLSTACSQNGGGDKVASISSAATATAAAAAGGTDEDKVREYVQCMRDHGVNMPDPKIGANGDFGLAIPDGVDKSKVDAADPACRSLMPNGGAPKPATAEELDKQLQLAKCLREHGVDVKDPTPDHPGIQLQNDGPPDQKVDAAMAACGALGGGGVHSQVGG
ncbi:hypothetical protein [Amycolatopsis taiwanensis]|uniref:hypothetical protein n=1 Tax=Amycolatopsis taiwanensis TaxID=342230 RepID=UPI0004B0DAB6|nr:hypothetical protein [Amycolatopsis taiwanensis]